MSTEREISDGTLSGKVVLLAGGAGGLGAATAKLLAREGALLVIGYRANRSRAEALRQELVARGATVALVEGDLNQPEMVGRYLDRASTMGQLTGLVVFTGDPARPAPDARLPASGEEEVARLRESLHRSWDDNFVGPYTLAREAAQRIAGNGDRGGNIVLVASMQGVAPFAGSAAYAAPKAALVHAAKVLAYEFGGKANLCINVVAPGVTTSGMAASSVASGKYERYLKNGVIARYGRAEDVARAVRFLLEPDCYITGQVITVDGGLTLRR